MKSKYGITKQELEDYEGSFNDGFYHRPNIRRAKDLDAWEKKVAVEMMKARKKKNAAATGGKKEKKRLLR